MDSILGQTLDDIEIILVDDGSPDRVPEMCDEYVCRDKRIKVVHKENGGLGFARNSGLEVATGEYVAFVDSDDYVDKSMYGRLYDEAGRHRADAVFCGFNQEGLPDCWSKSKETEGKLVFDGESVRDFMLDMVANAPDEPNERRYYMSVWRAIYKRSIIERNHIRFLSERDVASEDIPFQVDFLLNSRRIVYIPDNFYYYCSNGTSLTATFRSEKYERFKLLRSILIGKLSDVEGSAFRCDRFFIGYTRTQLHHLMSSDVADKLPHIRAIVSDPIWKELKVRYPLRYFRRFDLRLMYWLILNKHAKTLIVNSILINSIRKALSRR